METVKPQPTIKDYYNDSYLCTSFSRIIQVQKDEASPLKASIILERTIFHPQGGGQPSDEGFIELKTPKNDKLIKFIVKELIADRESDIILHKGEYAEDYGVFFEPNDEVKLTVNEEKRRLNARLHSAGHLIDICVKRLGLGWSPGKGYHFPDGPYVEYTGKIPEDKPDLKEQLQTTTNRIITENEESDKTIAQVYDYEEAKKNFQVPDYLPAGKPFRWIKLSKEDDGCPCGGTHVKSIKEIVGIEVTKVQKKGKNVRVYYNVKN